MNIRWYKPIKNVISFSFVPSFKLNVKVQWTPSIRVTYLYTIIFYIKSERSPSKSKKSSSKICFSKESCDKSTNSIHIEMIITSRGMMETVDQKEVAAGVDSQAECSDHSTSTFFSTRASTKKALVKKDRRSMSWIFHPLGEICSFSAIPASWTILQMKSRSLSEKQLKSGKNIFFSAKPYIAALFHWPEVFPSSKQGVYALCNKFVQQFGELGESSIGVSYNHMPVVWHSYESMQPDICCCGCPRETVGKYLIDHLWGF